MCSFCQQTNKKEAVKMFFCIADFFFLRFETSQAPTTNNSENRDRTNKQTDKKKTQKNSTMIDDRRLLKPANENKTKQKNTEFFPQCLHTTTLILPHKIKKKSIPKKRTNDETS